MGKNAFVKEIISYIAESKKLSNEIKINIANNYNADIYLKKLDFDFDFEKDIWNKIEISQHKISLKFENIIFEGKTAFKNIKLDVLEFKDVTFKESVGIKNLKISKLIFRPYRIDANVVINIGHYAKDGLVLDEGNSIISQIEFEDPHICNGKIYFIGINKNTQANFTNRNLENVVFQNCNFENTYFLNAFLKESKFLNCEFPIIDNEWDLIFAGYRNKIFISLFYIIFTLFFYDKFSSWEASIKFFKYIRDDIYFLDILYLFIIPVLIIPFIYLICRLIEKFFSLIPPFNTTLIGKHYGILDEKKGRKEIVHKYKGIKSLKEKEKYYNKTMSNIENIYLDLKINFKNNGDEQKSGDFYYSANLIRITIAKRFSDLVVLTGSYIINGFGERPLKSFYSIIFLLIFISFFSIPNKDYISTLATPPFLLSIKTEKENSSIEEHISYKIDDLNSSFQKYIFMTYEDNNNSVYSFDTRFRTISEGKEYYIPKLKEDIITKVYYATSHIIMPFIQENKKWFQNIGDKAYEKSIIISLIIWLFIIGLMKAIFNRIRR